MVNCMKYVVNRMTVFNDSKVYLILSKRGRTYNFYIIDDAIIDVNEYVLYRNNIGKKSISMLIVLLSR